MLALFAAALGFGGGCRVNPASIQPAMLQWQIGVGRATPPYEMVETITAVAHGDRQLWRVTHYASDPTGEDGAGFDLCEVDAATLAPVRSVMHNRVFQLSLAFAPDHVVLRRVEGETAEERIQLQGDVKPEGPGLTVFVGGLPLAPGYSTRFTIVDRWAGTMGERLRAMTLSVTDEGSVETALGLRDAYGVVIQADDGSSYIRQLVRSTPPYYPYRTEYRRGAAVTMSRVTAMVF